MFVDIYPFQFQWLTIDEQANVWLSISSFLFDRFDFNTAESYIKRNNLIYFAILFDGHQQFVQIRMFGCPCIDICQFLIERKCTYFVRWDIGGLLFSRDYFSLCIQ